MLTTAAGTIRPQRSCHRRGRRRLQAIATAKRLGAVVEAYDVRSATKDQVKSLRREIRRNRRLRGRARRVRARAHGRRGKPSSRKFWTRGSRSAMP